MLDDIRGFKARSLRMFVQACEKAFVVFFSRKCPITLTNQVPRSVDQSYHESRPPRLSAAHCSSSIIEAKPQHSKRIRERKLTLVLLALALKSGVEVKIMNALFLKERKREGKEIEQRGKRERGREKERGTERGIERIRREKQ